MGLEDQYEEANGLPQPKRRESEERIPPVSSLPRSRTAASSDNSHSRRPGPLATIPPSAVYAATRTPENLSPWTSLATCHRQRPRSAHPSLLLENEKTPSRRIRSLPTPGRRPPAGGIPDLRRLPHSRTTRSRRSSRSLLLWTPSPVLSCSASCRRRKTWGAADALLCDSFSIVKA